MSHPARFTPAVLIVIAEHIRRIGLPVHDPFAGTGERLGALCDELGVQFTGTELEPEFIVDERVKQGNSTDPTTYPHYCGDWCRPSEFGCLHDWHDCVVVTSPVYPNGMTDHQRWKPDLKWVWNTYRHGLARITGVDRPLHEDNMGQYGNEHRRSKKSEKKHFEIARRCVRWWPEWAIVNVKDVVASKYEVDVTYRWICLMQEFGYELHSIEGVETPGNRNGANRHLRDEGENVLVMRRTN